MNCSVNCIFCLNTLHNKKRLKAIQDYIKKLFILIGVGLRLLVGIISIILYREGDEIDVVSEGANSIFFY